MINRLYQFVFWLSLILVFSIFTFHLGFVVFPVLFVLSGILLRTVSRKNYLLVYSFLIPVLPTFAGFVNSGFPNNYLILPLLVLAGIVIADSVINKEFLAAGKETIPRHYIYYLLVLSISFIFLILRWSNILLSKMAFLENTPVDISAERISFALIFPILELALFVLSLPYFVFCQGNLNKEKIVVAFLSGQSVSVLFALGQYILNKPITTVFNMVAGAASDPTAFGMLCAISFVLASYLIKKESSKSAYFFAVIFLAGIIISSTRVAYVSLLVVPLFGFRKIKKNAVWICSVLLLAFMVFIYIGKMKTDQANSVSEVKQTLTLAKNLIKSPQERNLALNSIMAGRAIIWDYALAAIRQFPLTGVGPGNFIFWGRNLIGKSYFINITLTANSYLFIAVANGLIGLGLFILFLATVFLKKKWLEKTLILVLLLMLVFNDSIWLSEVFLGFWLICSLGTEQKTQKAGKKEKLIVSTLVLLFVIVNIFNNSALMPHNWLRQAGIKYDYGFWYGENDPEGKPFNWTGAKAGVYIYLDRSGRSATYNLVCGAPLRQLPSGKQTVNIYWRGRFFKSVVFRAAGQYPLQIEDHKHGEGFLEFRVRPIFNLKRLGIGLETRDLGIQLSHE